jgi:hypothetical protein
MPKSSPGAPVTFDFSVDGRSEHEVKEMKEYGYGEEPDYAASARKEAGFFCSSCAAFEHIPHSMPRNPGPGDGYCHKFSFRDRQWGCCQGWIRA